MGFIQPKDKPVTDLDQKVERTAVEAARRKFSPEFMNRLDKVVVFHPLKREQLEEVLEIELGQVQQRVLETAKGQFLFRVTGAGRDFLLQEGTDQRYGARHLKRAIERHVVYPLANLLATEQVHLGDLVCIDWNKTQERLTFVREGEGALVTKDLPQTERLAAAAEAKDGKSVSPPAEVVAEERKSHAAPSAAPAATTQGRKKQDR
jgi:ATP-dependent Clp protease ATP-binding subunit ClpB